jgi:hypothetical protein
MSDTAGAGCLIVLNSVGTPVETWSGGNINGPWDLTAVSLFGRAAIFVSNVLNGTVANSRSTVNGGTVVRLDVVLNDGAPPRLVGSTVVGSGFAERTDPNALVVGPTGLALGVFGQLYVADTVNSRIAVIPFAAWRQFPAGGSLSHPEVPSTARSGWCRRLTAISSPPTEGTGISSRSPRSAARWRRPR